MAGGDDDYGEAFRPRSSSSWLRRNIPHCAVAVANHRRPRRRALLYETPVLPPVPENPLGR